MFNLILLILLTRFKDRITREVRSCKTNGGIVVSVCQVYMKLPMNIFYIKHILAEHARIISFDII